MTATLNLPQSAPARRRNRRGFASLRAISALILREMATSYGRSPGGYLWAVLEPVAGIALLSVIFSLAMVVPALGSNFQLFYATGLVPLIIFTTVSGRVAQSITYSRQLLAYPTVTFMDAILARFLLNMLTQIMVAYLIFGGIMLFYDTKVILRLPAIAAALGLTGALALGIGTLNCFLFTQFPLWAQIWSILMRPLFIISCVFVVFDDMPMWVRDWLWYNPIVHLVGQLRHGFYSAYHATYVSAGYVLGLSGLCMVFGILLLRKHQYSLLEK
jgi:capsular polysaccharide transport system permease protein